MDELEAHWLPVELKLEVKVLSHAWMHCLLLSYVSA